MKFGFDCPPFIEFGGKPETEFWRFSADNDGLSIFVFDPIFDFRWMLEFRSSRFLLCASWTSEILDLWLNPDWSVDDRFIPVTVLSDPLERLDFPSLTCWYLAWIIKNYLVNTSFNKVRLQIHTGVLLDWDFKYFDFEVDWSIN